MLHINFGQRERTGEVRRRGWGKRPGRATALALLSLAFWALIARIALRHGRVIVVTGAADAGADLLLRLLPGPEISPPEQRPAAASGDGETGESIDAWLDDFPNSGHFKIVGPKNFEDETFRSLLEALAVDGRQFTVATHHAEWLRREMRHYASQKGSRPIFWLSLL